MTVISSGQTVQHVTVNGYQEIISSGGVGKFQTVTENGEIVVRDGGLLIETDENGLWIIASAGKVVVEGGGIVSGGAVQSGGTYFIYTGAIAKDFVVGNNGLFQGAPGAIVAGANTVESGGIISGGTVTSNSFVNIVAGGSSISTTVASGGRIALAGTTSNATIQSGGVIGITSGGIATSSTVQNGGTLTVDNGGRVGNTVVSSGGVMSAATGATLSGNVILNNGASVTIPSTAGGSITFNGSNANLSIAGTGSPTTVISGFTGTTSSNSDGITLTDIQTSNVKGISYPDANHVRLSLKDGSSVTLNIVGVRNLGYNLGSDKNGDVVYTVCFLGGTKIAVPDGVKAVEDIDVGDQITISRDGATLTDTVTWAGKAHCEVRADLPDDLAGYPVRILKNAIADGVPFKDLLITAEHCLFFDGHFIPARMLVNGRSVFYDKTISSYDYYHIETAEHSIVSADGMLTESYLDTGNRRAFTGKSNVVQLGARTKSWETHGAAPLAVAREVVEPLYRLIEARAINDEVVVSAEATDLTEASDLHLETDAGFIIRPIRQVNNKVMFMVPGKVQSVRLVSNASRPCDVVGPFVDDRRNFGILIGEITLFENHRTTNLTAHLEDSLLPGWHDQEVETVRWTDGYAILPLQERDSAGISILSVQVHAAGPYLRKYSSDLRDIRIASRA
ncbi:outer membrane protein/adhesin/invasin TibA autotransporter [Acetobacter malorum]|uniref:Outer membrane protein/adhesin/invasin TibA autotransporter n=1 Tax=Acetobacter malorum TaxID=178901 RepID=A0A177G489_9PROT|nr:Hint domain-containing protein [Acetobacter malorum]OAG75153.1 outer membrane protein/adhesin/invasin TibA autotransporter [Acetobacter malorum]